MKKRLLGLLFVICAFGFYTANAQEFSPFTSSPFAGVTAGKLNPASLAGSKYKFDITLFGASGNVNNDLLSFSRKKILFSAKFYSDLWSQRSDLLSLNGGQPGRSELRSTLKEYLTGHTYIKDAGDWDKETLGGYASGHIDILNVLWSVNDRLALALGYGIRWQAGAHNVPTELVAEVLNKYGKGHPAGRFDGSDVTAYFSTYDQLSLSAAYSILKSENHVLKLGVTGKLLFSGIGGHQSSAFVSASNIAGSTTGLTSLSGEVGKATKGGLGIGGDFGVEYEYQPAALKGDNIAEYRIKAGASILDFGGYTTKDATYRGLKSGSGIPTGINDFIGTYGSGSNKGEYTIGLPTVIAGAIDYRLIDNVNLFGHSALFLNLTGQYSIDQTTVSSAYKYHYAALSPRLDWRKFGVSVPLRYDQFGNFTAGFSARLWNVLWVGSNTLLANNLIPKTANKAADFHIIAKIPIYKDETGDRDGDGIPDNLDACPDVKGLKKYNGCPDTDGDGIPDNLDACPNEAGPAATNGCPDRDGDGVPDKDDRCPDTAGPKELSGCPDKDGDGVPDIDDACVDQPGPKATKGCPDRDGDGVADKDDRCPDVPGVAALQGCPDSDGDGVADIDDECPTEAGAISNKGCPSAPAGIKNVEFDIDKYNIKAQYHSELDKAVDLLKKNPNATVTVKGHTDNTYTYAYNLQLSKRRAESVKNYLVQNGIDGKRIVTEYYSYSIPAGYTTKVDERTIKASNSTVEQRARNRRAEVTTVIK